MSTTIQTVRPGQIIRTRLIRRRSTIRVEHIIGSSHDGRQVIVYSPVRRDRYSSALVIGNRHARAFPVDQPVEIIN